MSRVQEKVKVHGRAKSTEILQDVLDSPTKRVGEAEDILSSMVRTIYLEKGLTFSQISAKTHDWLTRVHRSEAATPAVGNKYLTEFNNFLRQIAQRKITTRVFSRFIAMLGAKRFKLTLTLYYDDPKEGDDGRTEEYYITSATINARDDGEED